MKYNLIETGNIIDSIYELNNITKDELEKQYDFNILDEVFLNFKDKLINDKDLKFLIVGDYDADGICATTIIKKLFNYLSIDSNYIIPSRINQGYGLNKEIVKMAYENGFKALLLLDNGIVCSKEIELAYSLGLKVYIIDHHEYQELPKAEAIIHSKIVSNTYQDLSAGGLSFVLSRTFYEDDLSTVLGGLSTISDMMKVTGFNRYLIKEMMKLLETGNIYQMNYLNESKYYDFESLSFNVIPKINALSRMEPMGDPNKLVKYFLADEKTCRITIEQINYVNEQRKLNTKSMAKEAKELVDDKDIIVVCSRNFMEGLCGLIANKLVHEISKPVIVLALKDGMYKGSGRSIDCFNLYESLKDYQHYDSYGGHEGAIGLSFKEEDYQSFIDYISSLDYKYEERSKDVLLIEDNSINLDLLDVLNKLKPFGEGLKEPLFAIKNNNYKKCIVSNRFAKYQIRNDLSAISFNESFKDKKADILIGTLKQDIYHKNSIQMLIEDLL